jgi:hypothetical protein
MAVVIAQNAATAGECVLLQGASAVVLADGLQGDGEVTGRTKCIGVIVAEDAAASGQCVLVPGTGVLVFLKMVQYYGEAVGLSTDRVMAG